MVKFDPGVRQRSVRHTHAAEEGVLVIQATLRLVVEGIAYAFNPRQALWFWPNVDPVDENSTDGFTVFPNIVRD